LRFNLTVGLIAGVAHELFDVPEVARKCHKPSAGGIGKVRQLAHILVLVVVVGRRTFSASACGPIRREHLV